MRSYLVLFVTIVLASVLPLSAQTAYYVSSSQGNDSNNGTSSSSPWKSFSKVNSANFNPGDRVFFKCNDVWSEEQLKINNSGNQNNLILFSSYGTGEKPIIDGNGTLANVVIFGENVHHCEISNLWMRNCDVPNYATAHRSIVLMNQLANNLSFINCKFSQIEKSGNQWCGMVYGRDNHHITIQNSEFTGGLSGINIVANYESNYPPEIDGDHNDVHHIIIDNNWFHRLSSRPNENSLTEGVYRCPGIWFQSWFVGQPDVEGIPGDVLGQEGIYRDIWITNNEFDSIHYPAIYWYRDRQFYTAYPKTATSIEKPGYNWFIQDNTFNLVEGAAIEIAPVSNRWGQNHPETGVPIGWSVISGNRIDSCGYNYATGVGGVLGVNTIESHGWKQVYVEDNYITYTTGASQDSHGFNFDWSPALNGDKISCDSIVVRRNVIAYNTKNGYGTPSNWGNFTTNSIGSYTGAGIQFFTANSYCEVYDNIIYECSYGISLIYRSNRSTNKIYNNTFFKCDIGMKLGSVNDNQTGAAFLPDVKNNIVAYSRLRGFWGTTTSAGSSYPIDRIDYNLLYQNLINYQRITAGANNVYGNPVFVDTTSKNFDVLSGGFGIDSGQTVTSFKDGTFTDFLNRSVTGQRDIGAYEFDDGSSNNAPLIDSIYVTSVSEDSVVLNAEVNTGNQSTTVRFQWDLDSNAVWTNDQLADNSPLTTDGLAARNVTGLSPNTTYYFRAYVSNASGSDTSFVKSFTTLPVIAAPTIDSIYVDSLTQTTAKLNAEINAGNQSTTIRFQWDLDNNAIWANDQLANNSPLTTDGLAARNVTGLSPNTTYYFRAYVSNASGSDTSIVKSFTTLPVIPAPTIDSVYVDSVTQTTVKLNAEINTGNQSTTIKFQWDIDSNAVWANDQLADNSPLTTDGLAARNVTGLSPNTTYYFRAYVSNASGSDTSIIKSFTTASSGGTSVDSLVAYPLTSNDDGYLLSSNTNTNRASLFSIMGNINGGYRYALIRFTNVGAAAGKTIDSAFVYLTAYGNSSYTGTNIRISANDTVNAQPISSNRSIELGKTLTTAKVDWNGIPNWLDGIVYKSRNIKTVIQEWADISNHQSGDALLLFFNNNSSSTNGRRVFSQWDHVSGLEKPKLVIYYSAGFPKIANGNEEETIPDKYELYQNYPNPFNPSTNIKFSIPFSGRVRLDVFNILGEHLITLLDEDMLAGLHDIPFNAGNLASGTYIYRLITDNFSQTKKMILIK